MSRKAIQAHITSKINLRNLDLDTFTLENGEGYRIIGKGTDKTFKTAKSAKAYVTRLSNKILIEEANAIALNRF